LCNRGGNSAKKNDSEVIFNGLVKRPTFTHLS
jgi:hypothetical protein